METATTTQTPNGGDPTTNEPNNCETSPQEGIVIDDEPDELQKCFKTITEGKDLLLNWATAETIVKSNLGIEVSEGLLNVLIEMIPFYMHNWPGWARAKDYLNGKIELETWYERFREYLNYKLNTIIRNERKYINQVQVRKNRGPGFVKDGSCQTQSPSTKDIKPDAGYTLDISGPPSVVSNLVFLGSDQNIVIKQHMDKSWDKLLLHEFLNWPYIAVDLKLPELSLSREVGNEYHRYVTICGDVTANPENEFIDSVTELSDVHQVFSYSILHHYINSLTTVLRSLGEKHLDRVKEITTILNQFLNDISAVNINDKTIATNCKVSFNIGKSKYIRNKKMIGPSQQNAINFYEVLIPRVQFALHSFTAQQDMSTQISFKSVNSYKAALKSGKKLEDIAELWSIIINTCIEYKCLFCRISFKAADAQKKIMHHLEHEHKNEQSVLCFKCRRQFEISQLAGNRWAHDCVIAPT